MKTLNIKQGIKLALFNTYKYWWFKFFIKDWFQEKWEEVLWYPCFYHLVLIFVTLEITYLVSYPCKQDSFTGDFLHNGTILSQKKFIHRTTFILRYKTKELAPRECTLANNAAHRIFLKGQKRLSFKPSYKEINKEKDFTWVHDKKTQKQGHCWYNINNLNCVHHNSK